MTKIAVALMVVVLVLLGYVFTTLALDVDDPEYVYLDQYVRDTIGDYNNDPGNLIKLVNDVEIGNLKVGPQTREGFLGRKVRTISFDSVALMQVAQTDGPDSGVITKIATYMVKVHVDGLLFFDSDQTDFGIDLGGKKPRVEIFWVKEAS